MTQPVGTGAPALAPRETSDQTHCCHHGDNNIVWLRLGPKPTHKSCARNGQSNTLTIADLSLQKRIDIADDASTSVEILLVLAKDTNADVRYALAENHNIDRRILKFLSADENPYVAHRANTTLTRLG